MASSSKVKSMISIYENYSYTNVTNEPATLYKNQRRRSLGSINPSFGISQEEEFVPDSNLDLIQIEQQVQHLNNKLNNYRTYSRENHIFYQNQIFFLLTDIINVDAQDDPYIISKKSELIELLKRLNTGLNSRLPSANKKQAEQLAFANKNQVDTNKKHMELSFVNKNQIEQPIQKKVITPQSPSKRFEDYQTVSRRSYSINDDKDEKKVITPQSSVKRFEDYQTVSRRSHNESVDNDDKDEYDGPVPGPTPSVKTLKQLWEKNISEGEKQKEQTVKVSQVFLKLNGSSTTKYIPFSERMKEDSFDANSLSFGEMIKENSFDGDSLPLGAPSDFYEKSKSMCNLEVNGDEKSGDFSPDSLSGKDSEGNSDAGSDVEEKVMDVDFA